MSIRTQVTRNTQLGKSMGYIDFGGIIDPDPEGLVTEVLVFMIVSLCGNFKCSTAYFLVNKISSELQSEIIKVCLQKLHQVGVYIHSVTYDGAVTNIRTLKLLGCNLNLFNNTALNPHED